MKSKITAIVIDINEKRSVVVKNVDKNPHDMTDDEIKKFLDANRNIVIVGENDWLNDNKDVI